MRHVQLVHRVPGSLKLIFSVLQSVEHGLKATILRVEHHGPLHELMVTLFQLDHATALFSLALLKFLDHVGLALLLFAHSSLASDRIKKGTIIAFKICICKDMAIIAG